MNNHAVHLDFENEVINIFGWENGDMIDGFAKRFLDANPNYSITYNIPKTMKNEITGETKEWDVNGVMTSMWEVT